MELGTAIYYALQDFEEPSNKYRAVKCALAFGHSYWMARVPNLHTTDRVVSTCSDAVAFLLLQSRTLCPKHARLVDPDAMAEALIILGQMIHSKTAARNFADMLETFEQSALNTNCKNLNSPEFAEFTSAISRAYALSDEVRDDEGTSS